MLRRRLITVLCCVLVPAFAASPAAAAASRPHISGRLDGLAEGKPMLRFSVEWASARIQSATLGLPDGLTFNAKTVSRRLLRNGRLTERFYKPGVTAFTAEIPVGQLRESKQLRRQVHTGKVHLLTFKLWVKNGKGKTKIVPLRIRPHKTGWSS